MFWVFMYLCFGCSCICVFAAGAVVRLVVRPHQERFRQQLGTGFLPHKPLWCPDIMMTMMRRGDGVDDDDGGISMLGAVHILPHHTQSEQGQQVMTIDNEGGITGNCHVYHVFIMMRKKDEKRAYMCCFKVTRSYLN